MGWMPVRAWWTGLRALGRGYKVAQAVIPLVPGAILFDLINGGEKGLGRKPPTAPLDAAPWTPRKRRLTSAPSAQAPAR